MYHFLIRWVDSSSSLTFVDLAFTDLYLLRSKLLFRMRMQLAVVLLYDCQNINVDDEDGTRCRVTTALCSMNQSRTTNFTRWPLSTPGHLDPDHKVVMTEYVAGGGDGFKIIAENKEKHLQVKIYLAHTSFHHMPSRGPLTLTFWGNTSKRDRRWIISEPLVSTVIQNFPKTLLQGGGTDRDADDPWRTIFKLCLLILTFAHQLSTMSPNPVLCHEEISLLKIYIYFEREKWTLSQKHKKCEIWLIFYSFSFWHHPPTHPFHCTNNGISHPVAQIKQWTGSNLYIFFGWFSVIFVAYVAVF